MRIEIKLKVECHTRLSWSGFQWSPEGRSAGCGGDRAYHTMRIEIKNPNQQNTVPGQVGQMSDPVRYRAQPVVAEIEPIEESDEN